MESILSKTKKIKAKSLGDFPALKARFDTVFDPIKSEVSFKVNRFAGKKCHRLVHDGKKVIAFFEAGGTTETIHTLVCGSEAELKSYIKKSALKYTPEPDIGGLE